MHDRKRNNHNLEKKELKKKCRHESGKVRIEMRK